MRKGHRFLMIVWLFNATISNKSNKLLIKMTIPYSHQFRLILSSILLTSKFYNDVFYGNHFVAYVGGVHLQEMNLLESEFLDLIDWRIWVDP